MQRWVPRCGLCCRAQVAAGTSVCIAEEGATLLGAARVLWRQTVCLPASVSCACQCVAALPTCVFCACLRGCDCACGCEPALATVPAHLRLRVRSCACSRVCICVHVLSRRVRLRVCMYASACDAWARGRDTHAHISLSPGRPSLFLSLPHSLACTLHNTQCLSVIDSSL